MRKKWETGRKWEASRTELAFEKLLARNGYRVIGLRECSSKTDYLIEKRGIQQEFSVYNVDNLSSRWETCFLVLESMFHTKEQYLPLKEELEKGVENEKTF